MTPDTSHPSNSTAPIQLEISGLSKQFGGLRAVANFDLVLREKELVGLIGPNGAGKTTIFNMITGIYVPTTGSLKLRRD